MVYFLLLHFFEKSAGALPAGTCKTSPSFAALATTGRDIRFDLGRIPVVPGTDDPVTDPAEAVKIAVDRAGITKRVGTHTLRHSFATHLLEDGVNIRVVQELMGHADVKTTEIYTHVMEKDIQAVKSPLETQ